MIVVPTSFIGIHSMYAIAKQTQKTIANISRSKKKKEKKSSSHFTRGRNMQQRTIDFNYNSVAPPDRQNYKSQTIAEYIECVN